MTFKQSRCTSSLEEQANIIKAKQKRLFPSFQNCKQEKKLYFSNCPQMWKNLSTRQNVMPHIAEGNHHWEVAENTEGLSQNWTMSSNLDNFGRDGNVVSGDLINWYFVKIKHLGNPIPSSLHFFLDSYENRGLWMHSDFHSIIRNQFIEMLEITNSVPWQLSWKIKF